MPRKALLVVDLQYDFLPPNGSLAVPDGETVLPFINDLLEHSDDYEVIAASMVRHPNGHISFASTHSKPPFTQIDIPILHDESRTIPQMLWPDHCIQDTFGSQIEETVKAKLDALGPEKVIYIKKGELQEVDAYSAFADNEYSVFTGLAKYLYQHNIDEIDVVGLALDYCVKNTLIDARKFGFKTRLLEAGTKAVDPSRGNQVLEALRRTWKVDVI
ncbi:nicotinamidase [Hysterangium stoloniferum]|nr:nicotinamidase [Hysterangium stoloniferum]